jgi:hypothetical protein
MVAFMMPFIIIPSHYRTGQKRQSQSQHGCQSLEHNRLLTLYLLDASPTRVLPLYLNYGRRLEKADLTRLSLAHQAVHFPVPSIHASLLALDASVTLVVSSFGGRGILDKAVSGRNIAPRRGEWKHHSDPHHR